MSTAVHDVPTPFVYIDLDRLERNISRLATLARDAGIALRPHAKTHKLVEIGRMQIEAGAIGLTLAKLTEAEAFVDAGLGNILISFPVATDNKLHQFLDLSERTEMLMSFDSIETVERLGKLACERRMEANVLLIVDIGFHRLGVPVGEAVSTAIAMARVRGIRLRGVQIYAGHIYSSASLDEATRIAHDEIAQAAEVADRIRKAGIEIDIISIGSTPSSLIIAERRWTGATELRAGNYVFMDRQQVRLGIANYDDCALRVFATVISKPSRDRILIDAGSKTLTSDPARPPFTGFGHVVNKRGIKLSMLSEEVTTCHLATDADSVSVGELLEIVPNHACMMTNLAERIYVGRNGLIEDAWTAQARGKVW